MHDTACQSCNAKHDTEHTQSEPSLYGQRVWTSPSGGPAQSAVQQAISSRAGSSTELDVCISMSEFHACCSVQAWLIMMPSFEMRSEIGQLVSVAVVCCADMLWWHNCTRHKCACISKCSIDLRCAQAHYSPSTALMSLQQAASRVSS